MTTTLDIAAVLSAVIWPIVVLVILLAFRAKIPALVEGFANRVTKLEVAGVGLELAVAKPYVPKWSGSGALDLRRKATAMQVDDNTARTFLTQLAEEGSADYAEINLGTGEEWLTSRLFIIAIIFARMKGIRCFVFFETSGNTRKRYVGWAEPAKIRWALARHYPWFEQAYADAYATIMSQYQAVIVSNQGRLEKPDVPRDPKMSIELLKEFLQRVQAPPEPLPIPPALNDWASIDPATNTYEHAQWLTGELLETILGNDLNTATIRSTELLSSNTSEQLRAFVSMSGQFIAVVADDQRFSYLVDREVLIEQVAGHAVSATDA